MVTFFYVVFIVKNVLENDAVRIFLTAQYVSNQRMFKTHRDLLYTRTYIQCVYDLSTTKPFSR